MAKPGPKPLPKGKKKISKHVCLRPDEWKQVEHFDGENVSQKLSSLLKWALADRCDTASRHQSK